MMRALIILSALSLWASLGPAAAQHCWYKETWPPKCVDENPRYNDGMLKAGWHVRFSEPTNRYGHAVLGDTPEWGELQVIWMGSRWHGVNHFYSMTLPENRVFEDLTPRVHYFGEKWGHQYVVTESDASKGARVSIYATNHDTQGFDLVAATPFIGTRNRWLAIVSIGDLNGDGHTEIAYIDRPHLAKTLRVFSFQEGTLKEIASAKGFTNHKIGEDFITSGLRECDGKNPEMIMVDAKWNKVMAVSLEGSKLTSHEVGPFNGRKSVEAALRC